MSQTVRVLISGFEPFGGEVINPSAELLKLVKDSPIRGLTFETILLPVSFDAAYPILQKRVNEFHPDVVVCLGQAGGRACLNVERVAINCIDTKDPDNRGVRIANQPIVENAPVGLFTTLPFQEMVDASNMAGVAAEVSNTAGTYVCNALFYRLIEENRLSARRCGFIHVPYLPEQAAGKNPLPASMSLSDMSRGLHAMLGVFTA